MCNAEVRKEMRSRGVRQWEVANYLGISESTMCRKMRSELDPDFRKDVEKAILALRDTPKSDKNLSK